MQSTGLRHPRCQHPSWVSHARAKRCCSRATNSKRFRMICRKQNWATCHWGVSENVVYPYTQWLMIIIPTKWLFHWGYTSFSDKSIGSRRTKRPGRVFRVFSNHPLFLLSGSTTILKRQEVDNQIQTKSPGGLQDLY